MGYEFNLNSPKQLGQALFDKLGLPPRKKTKSGLLHRRGDPGSLRGYHPVIEDILQYRVYQKLNSTYGGAAAAAGSGRPGAQHLYPDRDPHRPHQLHRAESAEHPGAHPARQPPAGVLHREAGWLLADADYSQIELRILAHISGDETMRQAFANGEDIHRSTAAKIYSLPPRWSPRSCVPAPRR